MNLPLPDALQGGNAVNLLAGAFLLTALYAAAQRRVLAAIRACRFNAIALGLLAFAVAFVTGARPVALAALFVLAIKAVAIPTLVARHVRAPAAGRVSEPLLGVPGSMLVCAALAVLAYSRTRALCGTGPSLVASCLPVAVAGVLVGVFVMVSRRDPPMQLVGLALAGNSTFLAVVSLGSRMPLVVETGLLLDLLVVAALFGPFLEPPERRSRPPRDSDPARFAPGSDRP